MPINELEHGKRYIINHEGIILAAWHNGERWWLEDFSNVTTYALQGRRLIECDMFGRPYSDGRSLWTLDDLMPDSEENNAGDDDRADALARELLRDVEI